MLAFATAAKDAGIKVIIAGAGGAAHLPGMVAAATTLPVIGVPVSRPHLDGLDSLLSIVQMPAGIPVATMAIDGAENAALLAARILALANTATADAVRGHQARLVHAVTACGVGALLGAGVVALLNRRAAQAWTAGPDADDADDADHGALAPDAPGVTASEPVED